MKQIRKRLTYANVMSTIAVFLVIGGASALAASQLGKNTVGTKQLKKNAVTAAKIKNGAVTGAKIASGALAEAQIKNEAVTEAKIKNDAVTGAKIAAGAVDGTKIADGSVTGADINAGSTPFSQIVFKARGTSTVALPATGFKNYPLSNGTYTQEANRDDSYVGGLDVTFAPSCTAPRQATAYALVDSADPTTPTVNDVVAVGQAEDKSGGTVSKRLNMSPYITGGVRFQSPTATDHTISITTTASCSGGTSGVTATFAGVDVIGTK